MSLGSRLASLALAAVDQVSFCSAVDLNGAQARRAWLFFIWSRHLCSRDFNPKAGLHTLPVRLAVSSDIPVWVAKLRLGAPLPPAHDFVRLWIARLISAALDRRLA